jgi:DNA-binding NtrC family response regulator
MARADPEKEGAGIDLVLADLVMPGIGGQRAVAGIERRGPPREVLVMTGHALSGSLGELAETDALDVVQKPFEVNTLAQAVRCALSALVST